MGEIAALVAIAVSVIAVELLWRRSLLNGTGPRRKPRLAPESGEDKSPTHH